MPLAFTATCVLHIRCLSHLNAGKCAQSLNSLIQHLTKRARCSVQFVALLLPLFMFPIYNAHHALPFYVAAAASAAAAVRCAPIATSPFILHPGPLATNGSARSLEA